MSYKIIMTMLALGGHAMAGAYDNFPAPYGKNASIPYTTEVVTAYTTYCPFPTTVSVGPNKTYTVTEATTLTITDCPCTITKPVAPVYTTEVVTAYTTYCPSPTTISVNPSKTYTVTEATTLTITDCPCTVTKPVIPSGLPPAVGNNSSAPYVSPVAPPATLPPGVTTPASVPGAGQGPTNPAGSGVAPSGTTSGLAEFTGAAALVEAGALPLVMAACALVF